MEFLKRKHFSLWIITSVMLVAGGLVQSIAGLQGVPTWICLGLKSPFIEFTNELEVLANTSVPLNITKDEQALMHQEGLRKLGTFIKPVDLRDSTTGFVKANLTKKVPEPLMKDFRGSVPRRMHPIQEEMDQKQIILLDEDTDENGLPASLTEEDRKFIVPMALKNASPEPPRLLLMGTTTQRPTLLKATPKTAAAITTRAINKSTAPEFASNIDDLRNHILYLQNLTKHDSNFQSKFVVFPHLQKNSQRVGGGPALLSTSTSPTTTTTTTSTTLRPFRPIYQFSAPIQTQTRKPFYGAGLGNDARPFGGVYHGGAAGESGMPKFQPPAGRENGRERITIVPQVLLLNDQTSERSRNDFSDMYTKWRNLGRSPEVSSMATSTTSTTTTTTTTTTPEPVTTTRRYANSRRPTKKPVCLRNPESVKCMRQRRREELQRQRDREQLLREQEAYLLPRFEPFVQTINNTKRFAVSIEIPDSFKRPQNNTDARFGTPVTTSSTTHPPRLQAELLLRTPVTSGARSRLVRSHHKRRNIGGGGNGGGVGAFASHSAVQNSKFSAKYGANYYERDSTGTAVGRDFLLPGAVDTFGGNAVSFSNYSAGHHSLSTIYSEPVDLNPDLCYQVEALSYGQKKQCVLNTSVMPAISKGARAAIQECQYQFQNRRWNCSTTGDNTVFGPMTGSGSPEMAFIHALAASTVTSFIARACRDGQLASCGCSRGSRPKQLHDDWTWGGCGDDLEYAYKFATDFIDIREKETRRGTRGAGNPEKRRNKFHQRRNHQPAQPMQADDAMAVAAPAAAAAVIATTPLAPPVTSANDTKTTATTTTTTKINTTMLATQNTQDTNGHINNNHENSNKNVNNIAENSNSNNNNDDNGNKKLTATAVSDAKDMVGASFLAPLKQEYSFAERAREQEREREEEEGAMGRIKPEDLLELQERIAKEILNSKLQENEMIELQEKINREIMNSKVFSVDGAGAGRGRKRKRKNQRAVMDNAAAAAYNPNHVGPPGPSGGAGSAAGAGGKWKNGAASKARSLMNLHNNEAGRRAVIKKTRITCKCHGVSGSCSLITCWQQLSSLREIGDYLREKYEESTEVKLNKRGRLQVKDAQFKVPTAHDLVYLEDSPDWCRHNRQLQWPGTHGRICNKTSSGLDGCGILCCGRGYNTKNIVVRERCNCKFHWCCQVKCEVCVKVLEEHTCK